MKVVMWVREIDFMGDTSWRILGEARLFAKTDASFQVRRFIFKRWYVKDWYRYEVIRGIE